MLAAGLFAHTDPLLDNEAGLFRGRNFHLLGVQLLGAVVIVAWSAFCCLVLLSLASWVLRGVRVSREEEAKGLDMTEHHLVAIETDRFNKGCFVEVPEQIFLRNSDFEERVNQLLRKNSCFSKLSQQASRQLDLQQEADRQSLRGGSCNDAPVTGPRKMSTLSKRSTATEALQNVVLAMVSEIGKLDEEIHSIRSRRSTRFSRVSSRRASAASASCAAKSMRPSQAPSTASAAPMPQFVITSAVDD